MKNLLLIAVTILAVGCGEKNEPVAVTKPVEEKQQEIKEEVKAQETVVESTSKADGVNLKELEFRGDFTYLKGSNSPYTGKYYTLYENGQKEAEGNLKNGKQDGLTTEWYENGKKAKESNFKDGEKISEKWWNSKGEPVATAEDSIAE